jgi:hypothetical protein
MSPPETKPAPTVAMGAGAMKGRQTAKSPSRELKSPCQARAFGREFERALTKETDA